MGFFDMLAVLFIGLKLANIITWSWAYVLMPLWLPAIVVATIFVVGLLADK